MSDRFQKPSKSCWTCKDRKIRCDRGVPTCHTCIRSSRPCQGYGARLSWPRLNDKKRSITTTRKKEVSDVTAVAQISDYRDRFINTGDWDLGAYYQLSRRNSGRRLLPAQPALFLARPPSNPTKTNHLELLHYFRNSASNALVTFNPPSSTISKPLMRMALLNDTVSGQALFYALLAFSSLHRYNMDEQAIHFKLAALRALSASSSRLYSPSVADAAQHVAACMLLCAFEILVPSETTGEWIWYVRGAMSIIQETRLQDVSELDGIRITDLLDWFYYHYALSRFATRHWNHETKTIESNACSHPQESKTPYLDFPSTQAAQSPNPSHKILNALGEVCDTLLDPHDPRSTSTKYKQHVSALQEKVENVLALSDQITSASPESVISVRVYQIATLIYMQRAYTSPTDHHHHHRRRQHKAQLLDNLVKDAFQNFVGSCRCYHSFPLFIIACEARSEEQRSAILKLISSSERYNMRRPMGWLREEIKRAWVQIDLYADEDLLMDYFGLLNAVTSSNRALPSYV